MLEEAGLIDIGDEGITSIARGGDDYSRLQCMGFQALMERGLLSQAECAELQKLYSDPSFSYVPLTVFYAWGKRAS